MMAGSNQNGSYVQKHNVFIPEEFATFGGGCGYFHRGCSPLNVSELFLWASGRSWGVTLTIVSCLQWMFKIYCSVTFVGISYVWID